MAGTLNRWGVPINQIDLARTLLDFTYVPITAMHRLGVGFTADERDDVYHLFRHVGHLLGLDPDLHFDNHEQATRLVELLAEVSGTADEASRALVEALLQAYDELLSPVLHTPAPVTHQLVLALARVFHGRTVGATVGLPAPAPWASLTVRALGRQLGVAAARPGGAGGSQPRGRSDRDGDPRLPGNPRRPGVVPG